MSDAHDLLMQTAEVLADRAAVRDENRERSMGRAVTAFWALYGDQIQARGMTELHGWEFMSILKKARSVQGKLHLDDYIDDIGYTALAAECAANGVTNEP